MYIGAHFFTRHNTRIIPTLYLLNVFKYNYDASKPFYKSTSELEKDFTTNDLRIAYATARALCSYHADDKELYFDIVASFLSHLNFLDKNTTDFLQLKKSRLERLRDFSKATQIGELAQGINSVFVQDRLNYPYVVDFHLFHQRIYRIPYRKGKTPDFLILNKNRNKIGLFESKGEAAKNSGIAGKLQGALIQLKSILKPCVDELVPCCTKFTDNSTDANKSSIHYNIFPNDCSENQPEPLRILRMSYASWFYLVGDFKRASELLLPEGLTPIIPGEATDNITYDLDTDNNKKEVYWVNHNFGRTSLTNALRLNYEFWSDENNIAPFRIGIYKSVVDQLLNNLLINENINNTTSDEIYERFADATLIKIGKDNLEEVEVARE
jgi:hypothetical protein